MHSWPPPPPSLLDRSTAALYHSPMDADLASLEQKLEQTLQEYVQKGGPVSSARVPSKDAAQHSEYVPEFVIKNFQQAHITQYPEGFNVCCGGTHVADVSEVEHIKIAKIKKKDGQIRISYEVS